MKKIVLLIIWMLPVFAFAQTSAINQLFDKYSGKDGFTSVYITKYMFSMFKDVDNKKEEGDFEDVATKLNFIKILAIDDEGDKTLAENFNNELSKVIFPKSTYKELMVIKDGPETIQFLFKDGKNKDSELVMVVTGDKNPVLLFLQGDISTEDLSKLSKTTNIDGFEHLDETEKNK